MSQSYAEILRRADDNSRSVSQQVRKGNFNKIGKTNWVLFDSLKKNVENVKNQCKNLKNLVLLMMR
jgi:DNA-binding CsgD family transcriptional regulator